MLHKLCEIFYDFKLSPSIWPVPEGSESKLQEKGEQIIILQR